MLLLVSLLSLILGALAGFWAKEVLSTIRDIKPILKRLKLAQDDKQKEEDAAVFVEPASALEMARREMDERIKTLNP